MNKYALLYVPRYAREIFGQCKRVLPNKAIIRTSKLQKVVTFVYWWPSKNSNGDKDEIIIKKSHRHKWCSKLMRAGEIDLESAEKYYRKFTKDRKQLYIANHNRHLELCAHIIPSFGHV